MLPLGTIHILRQRMEWLGGLRKWPFLLTFSILFILPCADNTDIVCGSKKVQECADVIYGWSISYLLLYFVASDEFDEEKILFYSSFCISRLNHRFHFELWLKKFQMKLFFLNLWFIKVYLIVVNIVHLDFKPYFLSFI